MQTLLTAAGEALALGPALADAAHALIDPGEPYELGLALSVSVDGRAAVLVSYNPRRRGGSARRRMLQALLAHGLPMETARAAMQWVPDDRCSTVLGLQWPLGTAAGGPVEATLYLEEISRFWAGTALDRTCDRLAGLAGVPRPRHEPEDPGAPYIWALDLSPQGPTALKTYRWVDDLPAAVARVAPDLPAPWGPALAGGAPAAGGILQRRHRDEEGAAPLKIYKAYAYEAGGGRDDAAAEVAALLGPLDPGGLLPRLAALVGPAPLTSVGLRLRGGTVHTGTAYWCVDRGTGATLPGPRADG